MDNKQISNYLILVNSRMTAKEIDGTTFIVESRYLGLDTPFRKLGELMLGELFSETSFDENEAE